MPKDHMKYIRKCPPREQKKFFSVLAKIEILDFSMLDVKKLKGRGEQYRCRMGRVRIIFEKREGEGIILEINTRGDVY